MTIDMAIDWSRHFKKYRGLWLALKADEKTVVGSGKTAKEAVEKASKKGVADPILTRMPKDLESYVGFGV